MTARLLLSTLYMGVLFSGAGLVLRHIQSFEGVIVVEKGRTERWVTRPAEGGRLFSTTHRNLPAEVIGFDNPRAAVRVLGTRDKFDAAPLPFRLRLEDVSVLEHPPDKQTLEIMRSGETMAVAAAHGQSVSLPEGVLRVHGVEPWRGLIRDGRGAPMAAVSLKFDDEPWSPTLFVRGDAVARPHPGIVFALEWVDDETQARALPPEEAAPTTHARWGVNEDGRTHWFETFIPGTGVTTAEDVAYVLLEVEKDNGAEEASVAAIVVGKKDDTGTTSTRVVANSESADGAIVLESHRNDVMVRLRAWRDGAAIAWVYVRGKVNETALLNEGESLEIEDTNGLRRIRLEQIMRAAIPVFGEESRALVMNIDDVELRLREGQSRQLDETRLRFRRIPQSPRVRYIFRAIEDSASADAREFALAPGDSRRIGQWHFVHDPEYPGSETVAILRARRVAGTPVQYFGAALFVVGAFGLCVFRFANWRVVGREDAATIMKEDKWTPVPPSADLPDNQDHFTDE